MFNKVSCLLFALLLLVACSDHPKQISSKSSRLNFTLDNDTKVCDTCKTVVIVQYVETTGSSIQVDSGIIYIPTHVVKKLSHDFDSLRKVLVPDTLIYGPGSHLNSGDLVLATKGDFRKLWPDPFDLNWHKVYRLRGKIVNSDVVYLNFPRLMFRMDSFKELDTAYVKKMMKARYDKGL